MSEKYTTERPDWVPEDADCKFTTSVMGGIEGIKDLTVGYINPILLNGQGMPRRKLVLSEDDYVAGVERGDTANQADTPFVVAEGVQVAGVQVSGRFRN